MKGTGICKRTGKCDMFHLAVFVPKLMVAEMLILRCSYDLEVSLLWQRSESTKIMFVHKTLPFVQLNFKV